MAIEMTFNKYMDNPSGGTSTFTNRDMYRKMYKEKYDNLLVREQGKILYKIYKTNNATDSYFIHFKIPSENLANLYYDTVIELWTKDNLQKSAANLRMYNIRVYSNDQAFIFSFAYAFNKNGLFIKELKEKMNKTALTTKGDARNPRADIWYVKSLCFAYYTMERYNLFSRPMLNQNSIKYNHSEFLKAVMFSDDKMAEHNKLSNDIKIEKNKIKQEKMRQQNTLTHQKFNITSTKTSSRVSNANTTKKSSRVKYTKSV